MTESFKNNILKNKVYLFKCVGVLMERQYIIDKYGVPVSVVIPISEWEEIQKKLQIRSDKVTEKNIKKDLKSLTEEYKSVKPFRTISDPMEWQKGIRDEW